MISNRYRIRHFEDEMLTPEETLADTLSQHDTVELPISRTAFRLLYTVIFLIFFVFAIKAFSLQVVNGEHYLSLLNKNSDYKYSVIAPRGIIYDSNNKPLVENLPILDAVVFMNEVRKQKDDQERILEQLGLALGIAPDELSSQMDTTKDASFFIAKRNISKEEVATIQSLQLKGVYVVVDIQRNYTEGASFAHILGYTSKVRSKDLSDDYYFISDRIGRFGLEDQYEKELRGEHTSIVLNGDDSHSSDVVAGSNLVLSIDKDVQETLYSTLRNVLAGSGINRGAAVVQDVRTGAVLAMVSLPSFDPNIFEDKTGNADSSKITSLLNDPSRPLFNRAISGRYSPGSTIKPLYALAGLEEGIVTPSTTVFSGGSISVPSVYDPHVSYTFKDWKAHGITDIRKAIADSVDIYFYAMCGGYQDLKGLGVDKMVSYLQSFALDKLTGIDLPGEVTGFIPTPAWKQLTKQQSWFIGDTYNISIGQGDMLVTPLWINSYISAIANGGSLMKPFIVKAIKSSDNTTSVNTKPVVMEHIDMNATDLQVVHEGMRQTITAGTGIRLNELPVHMAGKTGTAQVVGLTHLNSLFTAYGPYENPEIAITVLVEDIPKSQGLAIETARSFLAWYFGEHKTTKQ